MRAVIAPDSFKESLSAVEVAGAMAEGVRAAAPSALIDLCPMADGGEGTVEAMVRATGGEFRFAGIEGPLGRRREARFGLLGDGTSAVIEMAEAAGLALVLPEMRNPLLTTTFGVGQLLLAALDANAKRILVGIGGSATTDGGAGCAQALGVIFLDADGRECPPGLAGGGLGTIRTIDLGGLDPRVERCEILVACDVTNPLTGPRGAAAVYGPQKGATDGMVETLDAGLTHLAHLIRGQLGIEVEDLPGAGAAGGLGAGLVAFAGAELQSGVKMVADAVHLEERIRDADLVLTGEGRLDAQSAAGKAAVGVAEAARRAGVPCLCVPGQATGGAPRGLFHRIHPLVAGAVTLEEALADPIGLLRRRTAEAVRGFGWA